MRLQDPGERQAAEIGGVGDGEIEPPDRIGTSMARVRRPSSGSWKAIEPKFSPVRKRGVAALKAIDHDEQESDQAEDLGADQIA